MCVSSSDDHRLTMSSTVFPLSIEGAGTEGAGTEGAGAEGAGAEGAETEGAGTEVPACGAVVGVARFGAARYEVRSRERKQESGCAERADLYYLMSPTALMWECPCWLG